MNDEPFALGTLHTRLLKDTLLKAGNTHCCVIIDAVIDDVKENFDNYSRV